MFKEKNHSCYHSVLSRLELTSSSSSGSIIGASSNLGEHMGDEDSLFSHSVGPCVPSPVSRKERFSSLMLVWCLTISAGDAVSYSSRSTILLGSGHWAEGGWGGDNGHAMLACISNEMHKKHSQCSQSSQS